MRYCNHSFHARRDATTDRCPICGTAFDDGVLDRPVMQDTTSWATQQGNWWLQGGFAESWCADAYHLNPTWSSPPCGACGFRNGYHGPCKAYPRACNVTLPHVHSGPPWAMSASFTFSNSGGLTFAPYSSTITASAYSPHNYPFYNYPVTT